YMGQPIAGMQDMKMSDELKAYMEENDVSGFGLGPNGEFIGFKSPETETAREKAMPANAVELSDEIQVLVKTYMGQPIVGMQDMKISDELKAYMEENNVSGFGLGPNGEFVGFKSPETETAREKVMLADTVGFGNQMLRTINQDALIESGRMLKITSAGKIKAVKVESFDTVKYNGRDIKIAAVNDEDFDFIPEGSEAVSSADQILLNVSVVKEEPEQAIALKSELFRAVADNRVQELQKTTAEMPELEDMVNAVFGPDRVSPTIKAAVPELVEQLKEEYGKTKDQEIKQVQELKAKLGKMASQFPMSAIQGNSVKKLAAPVIEASIGTYRQILSEKEQAQVTETPRVAETVKTVETLDKESAADMPIDMGEAFSLALNISGIAAIVPATSEIQDVIGKTKEGKVEVSIDPSIYYPAVKLAAKNPKLAVKVIEAVVALENVQAMTDDNINDQLKLSGAYTDTDGELSSMNRNERVAMLAVRKTMDENADVSQDTLNDERNETVGLMTWFSLFASDQLYEGEVLKILDNKRIETYVESSVGSIPNNKLDLKKIKDTILDFQREYILGDKQKDEAVSGSGYTDVKREALRILDDNSGLKGITQTISRIFKGISSAPFIMPAMVTDIASGRLDALSTIKAYALGGESTMLEKLSSQLMAFGFGGGSSSNTVAPSINNLVSLLSST
ncbi:hypothetical protein ACFLR5_02250, partial [Elusimicrobiota bacterium]